MNGRRAALSMGLNHDPIPTAGNINGFSAQSLIGWQRLTPT